MQTYKLKTLKETHGAINLQYNQEIIEQLIEDSNVSLFNLIMFLIGIIGYYIIKLFCYCTEQFNISFT